MSLPGFRAAGKTNRFLLESPKQKMNKRSERGKAAGNIFSKRKGGMCFFLVVWAVERASKAPQGLFKVLVGALPPRVKNPSGRVLGGGINS